MPDIEQLCKLHELPETELLNLIPQAKVEETLAGKVTWNVLTDKHELLDTCIPTYNQGVAADISMRYLGKPPEQHPLHQCWTRFGQTRHLANKLGYHHNQIAIHGTYRREPSVILHLAAVFGRTLHLSDIYLMNPHKRSERPLDDIHPHEGLHNGIFDQILRSLNEFGRRHGYLRLAGYACDDTRLAIFQRRGWGLDQRDPALLARGLGNRLQIPICKQIACDRS